jgi:hypothetical protein
MMEHENFFNYICRADRKSTLMLGTFCACKRVILMNVRKNV